MNDGLSDDVKKKFRLPLTIELQEFHNAPVSPTISPKFSHLDDSFWFWDVRRYIPTTCCSATGTSEIRL